MNKENLYGNIRGRSSTIMAQYIKAVLGKPELTTKNSKEYYKKFGMDSEKCAYCGNDSNTLDHINSAIKNSSFTGYDHSSRNLIPCCQMCNSSKGNKTIVEWLDCEKITKRALFIKESKDYSKRRKLIDEYIRKNNSNKKAFDGEILKEMNKKARAFYDIQIKKLNELDKILLEDKKAFDKMVQKQ